MVYGDKEFLYFRLSSFYPHIYVTLSYLNFYTAISVEVDGVLCFCFFLVVYFGNINGYGEKKKQQTVQSLSSTNKTLGGLRCVPHPSEFKKK